VLLRIEANNNQPSAGFPMPVLRYIVGSPGAAITARPIDALVAPLSPGPGASLQTGRAMDFAWTNVADTAFYRLEIESVDDGTPVLAAIVPSMLAGYRAPQWLGERAGTKPLHWRVVAVDPTGRTIAVSDWRSLLPAKSGGK